MRILVTGGCGFIGHHLCHHLVKAGHSVIVLDNLSNGTPDRLPSAAALRIADVADQEACLDAMAGADACVHLAAIASVPECERAWHRASAVNLLGTVNVFSAAARQGAVPVVYASSAAVYGAMAPPSREDAPVQPLSIYGVDKLGCEFHARAAGASAGLRSVGLRFFNVYGPGQDPASPYSGVITQFHSALAAGRPGRIFGDGHQSRDFIYVADVVAAIDLALKRASPDAPVVNVCTGESVDLLTLHAELARGLGVDRPPDHGEARPGDIRQSRGDPEKAAELLGFRATVGLHEGLRRFVKTP